MKWDKIILSIVSVGFLWSALKVFFMLLFELTGVLKWLMPLVGYTEDSKCYYFFNGIHQMKYGNQGLYAIIVGDVLIFLVALIILLKQNAAKKLLIIEHTSLQHMSFSYNNEELNEYAVEKFSINQCKTINDNTLSLEAKVSLLITEIQNILPKINEYVDKEYQIGYAGIPVGNIPSVFFLGYELDDANKKMYFHKNRNNPSDDDFHILKADSVPIELHSESKQNNPNAEGKLLVIIQLTQPIKDDDLEGILEDNDYVLKYNILGQINYDIVISSTQTNKYADQIVGDIAEIQKNSNISEIKICIAASSDFIFALGTKFSKTQNIDTIIYQFEKNRYPWGINVTKEKAVINN